MGFLQSLFGEKVRNPRLAFTSPEPSASPVAQRSATGIAATAPDFEQLIRDYTSQPSMDPALLQTILPRNGECAFTISGLDGVLTVGRDMVMSTDSPVRCQTVRVLGTLEATVYAQRIIIAEGAKVIGTVRVNDAEISGAFDGSLQARGSATIAKTASVFGKVRALELTISNGALVHGADIKRVVPSVFDELNPDPNIAIDSGRFDDGYASMCVTVSKAAAVRR
jgi:hypothetical protein